MAEGSLVRANGAWPRGHAGPTPGRSIWSRRSSGGSLLVIALLFCNVFVSKFGIPGSDGQLSLRLAILFVVCLIGVGYRQLSIDPVRLLLFLAVCLCLLLETLLLQSERRVSWPALALLLYLILPYVFFVDAEEDDDDYQFFALNQFILVIAILGLIQWIGQFVFSNEVVFAFDLWIPESMRQHFNSMIDLGQAQGELVGFTKPNGVFLLEPSALSQYMALGIIAELIFFQRPLYIAVFGACLLAAYSGTGWILLAVVVPFIVGARGLVIAAVLGLLAYLAFSIGDDTLKLSVYVDRLNEFNTKQSSAYARFVSMYELLGEYVWTDYMTTLFGRGPGNATEFSAVVDYTTHDTTWGKILYEYGLVGGVFYFGFVFYCLCFSSASRIIKFALAVMFLFLGGAASIPDAHILNLALVVWPGRSSLDGVRRQPLADE